jgi:YD repeat-containing protein
MKVFEKLGIPDNIFETAEQLFNGILNYVDNLEVHSQFNEDDFKINIKGNISDLDINEFNIKINVDNVDMDDIRDTEKYKVGDIIIMSMSINSVTEKDVINNRLNNIDDESNISINLVAIDSFPTNRDIVKFLKSEEHDIVESLGHELKHKYDMYKKKSNSIEDRIKYTSYKAINFPFQEIDKFLHYLYYTTTIENLVRPSEVYTSMRKKDINKDNFDKFLKNNNTYKTLREISNFSIKKFKDDIKSNKKMVNDLIKNTFPELKLTQDEKVDKILYLLYVNLCNAQMSDYSDFLIENGMESIFGITDDRKKKLYDDMAKKVSKYRNNVDKFYEDTEKMFKFVSDKYIKKISKLYDMANDTNSIKDWDLHQKINNKITKKFETKILNFSNFKSISEKTDLSGENTIRDEKGNIIRYESYDSEGDIIYWYEQKFYENGKLKEYKDRSGSFQKYKFDKNGNLIEKVTNNSIYKAEYDDKNRLIYIEEEGRWKKYTYDKYGYIILIEFSGGNTTKYEKDIKDRVINQWVNGKQTIKNYKDL